VVWGFGRVYGLSLNPSRNLCYATSSGLLYLRK